MKSLQKLRDELVAAGFEERMGKGSHRVYTHPSGAGTSLPMNHPSRDGRGYIQVVRNLIRSVNREVSLPPAA